MTTFDPGWWHRDLSARHARSVPTGRLCNPDRRHQVLADPAAASRSEEARTVPACAKSMRRKAGVPSRNRAAWTDGQTTANALDAAQRPAFLRPQMSVQKRTARARGTAYGPLMGSPHISAPSCPHCRGSTRRNTRPSRSGCYRICSGCNHLWHVTGEALRAEKAPLPSRCRAVSAIPTS
jgi:hypothetical protein